MRRQRSLSVVLVGKNILLREGLAKILRAANFRILASLSSADDLRPGKPTPHSPLFLIVHTGDDFDGALEQVGLFRNKHQDGRIAIVADHYGLNEMISAFRAGANGYFVNAITCDRFTKSVELVMMGETIFPLAFLAFALDPSARLGAPAESNPIGEPILFTPEDPTAPLLSPREKLILACIIGGDSNKCIARKMDIAEATVKVHVKAILRKIRVRNRTQAAIWAINNGPQMQPENGNCQLQFSGIGKSLATTSEINQPSPPIRATRDPRLMHKT